MINKLKFIAECPLCHESIHFNIVIMSDLVHGDRQSRAVKAGLERAKKAGKKLGRQEKFSSEQKAEIIDLVKSGFSYPKISEKMLCSKSLVCKIFLQEAKKDESLMEYKKPIKLAQRLLRAFKQKQKEKKNEKECNGKDG